jgi:AcrR family transcriptional regulator
LARRPPRKRSPSPDDARPALLAGESLLPPPRQERSRRNRAALLDAALATFAQRGYEAATLDEISGRAGVAVGGFYLHFRSKRQALLVLMDRLVGELAQLEPPAGSDARAAVETLVREALRVDIAYLGAYRAWHEAVLRDDELALLHASIDAWTTARVAALLGRVRAAPSARLDVDPAMLARVLNALFWRLTQSRITDHASLLATVTALVMHAIFRDDEQHRI